MHKRIAEAALQNLTGDKAGYFSDVVNRIAEDPRTSTFPNFIYIVLKETMEALPTYLEKAELINLLFGFVSTNKDTLQVRLFDRQYLNNPKSIHDVTDGFVSLVIERTMQRYENGEIDSDEVAVQKFTWPYRAEDLVDPDDDEALNELENKRSTYTGPERRKR